jgi:hypothetical protein
VADTLGSALQQILLSMQRPAHTASHIAQLCLQGPMRSTYCVPVAACRLHYPSLTHEERPLLRSQIPMHCIMKQHCTVQKAQWANFPCEARHWCLVRPQQQHKRDVCIHRASAGLAASAAHRHTIHTVYTPVQTCRGHAVNHTGRARGRQHMLSDYMLSHCQTSPATSLPTQGCRQDAKKATAQPSKESMPSNAE